jgi:hypothetical protein
MFRIKYTLSLCGAYGTEFYFILREKESSRFLETNNRIKKQIQNDSRVKVTMIITDVCSIAYLLHYPTYSAKLLIINVNYKFRT